MHSSLARFRPTLSAPRQALQCHQQTNPRSGDPSTAPVTSPKQFNCAPSARAIEAVTRLLRLGSYHAAEIILSFVPKERIRSRAKLLYPNWIYEVTISTARPDWVYQYPHHASAPAWEPRRVPRRVSKSNVPMHKNSLDNREGYEL